MVSPRKRGRPGGQTVSKDATQAKRRSSGRAKAEVEDVIVAVQSFRKIGGVDHYQVKWSSSSRKDSWEPAKDVKKVAISLVKEYEESLKNNDDDEEKEYEVNKLVDRKKIKDQVKYLVNWKGFNADENTWENGEDLPKDKIKLFEKDFGELPVKGEKSKTTKKAKKVTNSVSTIRARKTINNVLHYEVKFVDKGSFNWLPIFEIEDVEAVKCWEESQYDTNSAAKLEEDVEYTVEKIMNRKGNGKAALYRVKWTGYPNSQNTWEKLSNLGGALKLVKAFDKIMDEKEKIAAERDYEVQKIVGEKMYRNKPVYMVRWKGFKPNNDTWEPAEQFIEAPEALTDWEEEKKKRAIRKVEQKAKADEKKIMKKAEKEAAANAPKPVEETSAEETPAETEETPAETPTEPEEESKEPASEE